MGHQFLFKLRRRVPDSARAVCGKTSRPGVGPELFTSTGGRVCPDCGRRPAVPEAE